jgi:cell shape-determining protein MreD
MTLLHTLFLLAAIWLAVFAQCAVTGPRVWLGAQVDLLPALMVYAGTTAGPGTVIAAALLGGLLLDSLSANPPGASVLPLLAVGAFIHRHRHLLVRDRLFAQSMLGLLASAAVPVMTLLVIFAAGERPLVGWHSLGQLAVLAAGGAVCTPVVFACFDRIHRAFFYSPVKAAAFRDDRRIMRGRR